jgi:chromosome segregation ATPase
METSWKTEVAMNIEELKAEAGCLRKEEIAMSKELQELQERFTETLKKRKTIEAQITAFEKEQIKIQVLRKGRPPVHQNRRPAVNFEKAVEMAMRGDVEGALKLLS